MKLSLGGLYKFDFMLCYVVGEVEFQNGMKM